VWLKSNLNLAVSTSILTIDSQLAACVAANSAESKKANSTLVLDVRKITCLADYFVITGGYSTNQVRAIAEVIEGELKKLGRKPQATEGKAEGKWVLLDYGDFIVHVLEEKSRLFYQLEQFWHAAPMVDHKHYSLI
jgi:ribosome-associated protein